MRLMEYQLADVREAMAQYRKAEANYGPETERQALIDFVDRVLEIVVFRPQIEQMVNGGLQRHMLRDPVSEPRTDAPHPTPSAG